MPAPKRRISLGEKLTAAAVSGVGAGLGYLVSDRNINQPPPGNTQSFVESYETYVNIAGGVVGAVVTPLFIAALISDAYTSPGFPADFGKGNLRPRGQG